MNQQIKKPFLLHTNLTPQGDQSQAIKKLTKGFQNGVSAQTLLGVTGSGKTFTMAHLIHNLQRPTLIVSHNKTLCAQLYREFSDFFPNNKVEYFISHYDYYQPEAYIPERDLYIAKDASINKEIEKMCLSTTASVISRQDTIVVASVSCIYGAGSPNAYLAMTLSLTSQKNISRQFVLRSLISMQYTRREYPDLSSFRVRGNLVDVFPAYAPYWIQLTWKGNMLSKIFLMEYVSNTKIRQEENIDIYPGTYFIYPKDNIKPAMLAIKQEKDICVQNFQTIGKHLEANRLESKVTYDLEMIEELGYCKGIENYSRHMENRLPHTPPCTLMDYFPKNFLLFIDESHVTLGQIKAMCQADQSRKKKLIEFGFRLPSALDNRPLTFEEFEAKSGQTLFVSATPASYELNRSTNNIVEQIIRPTGLLDPSVETLPTREQIDIIVDKIKERKIQNERVLITTLTKKNSEDLTTYLRQHELQVQYLHSEINAIDRVDILKSLRNGNLDAIVGVNLLREGLDLPEVSLIMILDADKIGFLRSTQALIQTAGRAARNQNGHVILFADSISISMKTMINETNRRRFKQHQYNIKNNITPKTIIKTIQNILPSSQNNKIQKKHSSLDMIEKIKLNYNLAQPQELNKYLQYIHKLMLQFAKNLEFEYAKNLRREIKKHEKKHKNQF